MRAKRLLLIITLCILNFKCLAQNIDFDPEQNINDQNSRMRYEFGTKTAQIFVDLFKIDNDEYLKNFNKVVMYMDKKLIDTLYLKKEYYNNGSGYYLYLYHVNQNNIDKISSLILKNIKIKHEKSFKNYLKNFISLFKSDFNNFLFNIIEVNGNNLVMKSNDNSEIYSLTFDNKGKIVNGKKNIKTIHEYGSFQYEESYTYYYNKLNNIEKKETLSNSLDRNGKERIDYSILETYSKSDKILQKTEKKYEYIDDKNFTIRETEELYSYNVNNNLREKKLIFNKSPKYFSSRVDYLNNIIRVSMAFDQNYSKGEIFEFHLLK